MLFIIRGGFGVDEETENTIWEFFRAFASDIAEDVRRWECLGYIEGANAVLVGHIITGMCIHVGLSYLLERQFTREEAISSLLAVTRSLVLQYLTDKGRRELGYLPELKR